MNSEDNIRILNRQTLRELEIKETQDKIDTKIVSEGNAMIALETHPGELLRKREFEKEIGRLTEKLINCHGTIREREALQMNIKMLKDFITSPTKYVDRLKQLHRRKIKQ
jgi:hypothetical protein